MLGQWCEEDDPLHWLIALGVWAAGAGSGWLVVCCVTTPDVAHWPAVGTAIIVSLITLALQYPLLTLRCPMPLALQHLQWLLGLLTQINWAGFLATRVDNSLVAAVVIIICLAAQGLLTYQLLAMGKLAWLSSPGLTNPQAPSSPSAKAPEAALPTMDRWDKPVDDEDPAAEPSGGEIRRQWVDAVDESGLRYLAGTVKVDLAVNQRQETIVLAFCPALDSVANLELECDSEEVTLVVDHVTETGARISLRRQGPLAANCVSIDWYATAGRVLSTTHSALP